MGHVLLLGDSIFDNASYVGAQPALIDQLRSGLPAGWSATLLASDGAVTSRVAEQLPRAPLDATHVIVSSGGNDALQLRYLQIFENPMTPAIEAFNELSIARDRFRQGYASMLAAVTSLGHPTAVCTIYDAVPGIAKEELTALSIFNDVIIRSAAERGLPVIDLRLLCTQDCDYSDFSTIEPSSIGGAKIAATIAHMVKRHRFSDKQTVIYG